MRANQPPAAPEHPFPAAVDAVLAAWRWLERAHGAVLLSPLLDLTASGASIVERADEDPIFTRDAIRGRGPVYLGDGDPGTPAASPLFGSMKGLPHVYRSAFGTPEAATGTRRIAEFVGRL